MTKFGIAASICRAAAGSDIRLDHLDCIFLKIIRILPSCINLFPVCNGQSRVIVNIFAELGRGGRGFLEVKDIIFFCCQANLSG